MFNQDKLFVSIPKVFEQYPTGSFQFFHGTATELVHNERTVTVTLASGGTETFNFHALVITTGASTASPLLGLNRDETFLRASWAAFRKALPDAKSIIIAGGGPAGVETAGELGEYLNGRAGWFSKLDNPKVEITLVTSGAQILPGLRTSLAVKAEKYLAQVGVKIIKNMRVKSVSPIGAGTEDVAAKSTVTLEDGTTLEADLYIPATGTIPNTSFVKPELLAADSRILTNASTLRVDAAGPRIYALGDASSAFRPACHLIFEAVPVVCANIKRDLLLEIPGGEAGAGEDRVYKEDKRETQLVPIGRSKGVGAAMGWWVPSFFVWAIKGRDYWLWTTGDLWSGKQWVKET